MQNKNVLYGVEINNEAVLRNFLVQIYPKKHFFIFSHNTIFKINSLIARSANFCIYSPFNRPDARVMLYNEHRVTTGYMELRTGMMLQCLDCR